MDELGQISTGQAKKPVKGYTGLRPRQQNYEVSDSEGEHMLPRAKESWPMLGFFLLLGEDEEGISVFG